MDSIKQFKEKTINDYISNNIDFTKTDQLDISKIKRDLKVLLKEEPGIKLNYKKENIISEGGGKKSIENLESLTVVFTYENQQPDGNGGYINIPIPVEKEFLLS